VLQFPGVVPVVGVDTISQVEELVSIARSDLSISPEEERCMARIAEELGNRFCRHCAYCQPCPQGIVISEAVIFPSHVKRFPAEMLVTGWAAQNMEQAGLCSDCGKCEERCPFNLPIREMLRENVALFLKLKASSS
jgi:predicted aldo/keto reductase-like oxidoreductase